MYISSAFIVHSALFSLLAFPIFQNVSCEVFGLITVGSEELNLTRNWALFVRSPNLELPVVYKRKEGYRNQRRDMCLGIDPR